MQKCCFDYLSKQDEMQRTSTKPTSENLDGSVYDLPTKFTKQQCHPGFDLVGADGHASTISPQKCLPSLREQGPQEQQFGQMWKPNLP